MRVEIPALQGKVLVAIDGLAPHAQIAAQFRFLGPLDLYAGEGRSHRGQQQKDGDCGNQSTKVKAHSDFRPDVSSIPALLL
jgi:hypothetical protein